MSHALRKRSQTLGASVLAAAALGLAAFCAAPALAAESTVTGSTVTGTVSVTGTVASLADVHVELLTSVGTVAYESDGTTALAATLTGTGSSGSFTIADVPAGTYYAFFYDTTGGDNAETLYAATDGGAATLAAATQVYVDGTNAATVPATTLPAGGTISGTLTDASNSQPIDASGTVEAIPAPITLASPALLSGSTLTPYTSAVAANGAYSITGLPAGSYVLRYLPATGTSTYPGVYYAASGLTQTPSSATPVTVSAGQVTSENLAIPEAGSLTGSVAAQGTNYPLGGVYVLVYDGADNELVADTTTAAAGTYSVAGLLPGNYKVEVSPSFDPLSLATPADPAPYAFQFFTGAAALAQATAIAVTAAQAHANVNFALTAAGYITGTVTSARGEAGLAGVGVGLLDAAGNLIEETTTAQGGTYTLTNLPAGKFYVEFGLPQSGSDDAALGAPTQFEPEYYGGKPTLAGARAVTVATGATVKNVNGALLPASVTTLGLPKQSSGKLSGLSNGRAALSVKIAPGSGESADLSKLTVSLPSGLRWNTQTLKKDLTLGTAKFTYTVKGATLTVTLAAGQRGFTLTVKAGGITDTKAVEAKAKLHAIASERVSMTVTDSQGLATSLSYTVKKPT